MCPNIQNLIFSLFDLTKKDHALIDAKSIKYAIAHNTFAIQPLNHQATEIVIQFVNRKQWIQFAPEMCKLLEKYGWTAKRETALASVSGSLVQPFRIKASASSKYQKEFPLVKQWIQALLSHSN